MKVRVCIELEQDDIQLLDALKRKTGASRREVLHRVINYYRESNPDPESKVTEIIRMGEYK